MSINRLPIIWMQGVVIGNGVIVSCLPENWEKTHSLFHIRAESLSQEFSTIIEVINKVLSEMSLGLEHFHLAIVRSKSLV